MKRRTCLQTMIAAGSSVAGVLAAGPRHPIQLHLDEGAGFQTGGLLLDVHDEAAVFNVRERDGNFLSSRLFF